MQPNGAVRQSGHEELDVMRLTLRKRSGEEIKNEGGR